ncbi:MAG: mannosyltransferase [Claussenomyces sp. TS43310]|nr:MAG: mannosyltransferase [Claussenomyces sp. TS43310]
MLGTLLTLAVVTSTTLTIILLLLPTQHVRQSPRISGGGSRDDASKKEPNISVQVLVLGDIGRSPRMQYHAMSIAKHGGRVEVIGYQESALHPGLVNNPSVSVVPLTPPPPILRKLQSRRVPFIIVGPLKVLWQIYTLFQILGYRTKPARWMLVQNPPSIPTLLIAMIVCFLRNTHLLIDWHNYGWSILAGTRGPSHPFVRISKIYECILGRWAPTASFAVTHAMSRQLRNPPYSIRSPVVTLHDRPAEIFQPISSQSARRDFLARLPETSNHAEDVMNGKTRLIVSSTSWTPDEDFGLFLKALVSYAKAPSKDKSILAIITGKGPLKDQYVKRIRYLELCNDLKGIKILTAWLSTEDYATLLACADLGVSLHMSSSGVDLPMKVVDMFGAGLPVLGYGKYESWPELVREGENGMGFETAEELSDILLRLFGKDGARLDVLREGAVKEGTRRWDEQWDNVAGRVLGFVD